VNTYKAIAVIAISVLLGAGAGVGAVKARGITVHRGDVVSVPKVDIACNIQAGPSFLCMNTSLRSSYAVSFTRKTIKVYSPKSKLVYTARQPKS
jgi:hypothetical protein